MKTGRQISEIIGFGVSLGLGIAALFFAFLRMTGFSPDSTSMMLAMIITAFLVLLIGHIPMRKGMRSTILAIMLFISLICIGLYVWRVVTYSSGMINPIVKEICLLYLAAAAGALYVIWKERRGHEK